MFTDLVGAMGLKTELGDVEALRLINEHHEIVRALLREFPEGHEIKTIGDSFFLAFHRPADAVGFALRLQSRLARWNRGKKHPLHDRVGLHAGEVTVSTDASGALVDLNGLEVDKCARLMSLASGRQILLTRFTFDNARAALKGQPIAEVREVRWESHGAYQFKGAAEPTEVFEVGEQGVAPLRAPDDSAKATQVAPGPLPSDEPLPAQGWRRLLAGSRFSPKLARWGAVLTAVVGLFALVVVRIFSPVLEGTSYDLAYLIRPVAAPTEGIIVSMDKASEKELGPLNREGDWKRGIHAQLLKKMHECKARAVVFDVWFRKPAADPAEDDALLAAVKLYTNVVVAGVIEERKVGGSRVDQAFPPFPALAAQARWGLTGYDKPLDWVIRQLPRGAGLKESLPNAVVRFLGKEPPPAGEGSWLNYYGPRRTIDTVSYSRVLGDLVEPSRFEGKVVFVGQFDEVPPSGGLRNDDHATPYTRWTGEISPGVEIVATSTLNLLRGDWLRRLSPWTEVVIVLLSGLAAGYGLCRLRPFPALAAASLAGLAVALVSLLLVWPTRVWFPWLVVSGVQLPVAFVWAALAWSSPRGSRKSPPPHLPKSESKGSPGYVQPVPAHASYKAPLPHVAATLTIADYDLRREIGRGAYGQVWLARDTIGQWRAVKVVHRDSFRELRPYEREFAGIKRFTPISHEHPGLVQVFHVGRAANDDYFYYVMELADDVARGEDIQPETYSPRSLATDIKARGQLPAAEVISFGSALGDALSFLHQQRLIHRDVKPANVLFVRNRPKLADIGLVTAMAETNGDVSYLGTEGYIAPEGPGAAVADVYSLGKLLYVATTGRDPKAFPEFPTDFDHRPDRALFLKLNEILMKACEPDAARRYPTAAALTAALKEIEGP